MITVVVPTVDGRADHLARCLDAYRERTVERVQLVIIHNRPTCGVAWQEGADQARGRFLHLTADDLEPCPGWDIDARATVARGGIPAPVILQPDGHIESAGGLWGTEAEGVRDRFDTLGTSVVPFCSMKQWAQIGPMLPIHYFTDNYFTHRARQAGIPVPTRLSYRFTHHWASAGRGAGMTQEERMRHDERAYQEAIAC